MGENDSGRICPVERAGALDNSFRRLLQNPGRILKPYLTTGDKVLDLGCGPGFFTLDIAKLIGDSGIVYAADIQNGMLDLLRKKIAGTELQNRVKIHKCDESVIGLNDTVDFVLAFYVIHELQDQDKIFHELYEILGLKGRILIIEPGFRVSKIEFSNMISRLEKTGFKIIGRPEILFSRSILIQKDN